MRWRGLDGVGLLVPESRKERVLVDWMSAFDPAPEPQVWVTARRRVDLFWRPLRLALEYQGRGAHAHAAGRVRDVARDAELDRLGSSRSRWSPRIYVTVTGSWIGSRASRLQRARELGVPAPILSR